MADADIPPPRSPYPAGADPVAEGGDRNKFVDGEQVEVIEAEISDSKHGIAPVVTTIALGVAASLVYDTGKWVVQKAWEAGTRTPLVDFERPPILYDQHSGALFHLQSDGSYLRQGSSIFGV